MKIQLTKGQIIKNHRELCEILGLEYTKGKGREYQIREFERYCTYHKEKQKYIVDEVFPEPKEKIDGRANNGQHVKTMKYGDLMDNILLYYLMDAEISDTVDVTINYLFQNDIILFGDSYSRLLKSGYNAYAKNNKITKGLVLLYQQKLRIMMINCFESSLNRLQKQNIIEWKKNVIVMDNITGMQYADDVLKSQIKVEEKGIYEAENEEDRITPFQRINPHVNKRFKNMVCKKIGEIYNYWNTYTIEIIDSVEAKSNIDDDLQEITKLFIDSLDKSIENYTQIGTKGKNKDKPYYPYRAEKHVADREKLHEGIWLYYNPLNPLPF